jgi:hypothetical protein
MKNTNAYTIVQEYSAVSLIEAVNLKMANGWTPVGGVCNVICNGYVYFYQAMVK